MIGAGDLVERVAFDQQVSSPDGGGGTYKNWVEQFQCRAGIRYLKGGESVIASRLEGTQPAVIRVRRVEQTKLVTSDWRIRDVRTGDEYNIRSKPKTVDRQYIEFTCESGVAA